MFSVTEGTDQAPTGI